MYGSQEEALQLHVVYKKLYFLQVMRESVSVLQVMWSRESVSGTTSHVCCFWMCNEIEGSENKIIVPSSTGGNITHLLPSVLLLVLRTYNNTDGNKLVIF